MRFVEAMGVWVEENHAGTLRVLHDDRLSARTLQTQIEQLCDREPSAPSFLAEVDRWLLYADDPFHGRIRGLLRPAFTVREIGALEHDVERVAHTLLDPLPAQGHADLAAAYAEELPSAALGLLLGVDVGGTDLHDAVHAVGTYIGSFGRSGVADAAAAAEEFGVAADTAIAAARAVPERTLLPSLLAAHEAGQLDTDELRSTVGMLIFSALETTRDLLTEVLFVLAQRPDLAARLRDDPGCSEALVQEVVRLHPPVAFAVRRVTDVIEVEGVCLQPGQFVLCDFTAANRDPAVFERPDEIDLDRTDGQVLSFGHGKHHCLGAALARLQAQVSARVVAERLPGLRLAVPADQVTMRRNLVYRGRDTLPVAWAPAPSPTEEGGVGCR